LLRRVLGRCAPTRPVLIERRLAVDHSAGERQAAGGGEIGREGQGGGQPASKRSPEGFGPRRGHGAVPGKATSHSVRAGAGGVQQRIAGGRPFWLPRCGRYYRMQTTLLFVGRSPCRWIPPTVTCFSAS